MIYLDNAATTFIYPEVIEQITKDLKDYGGNPSSLYKIGYEAKQILEESRTRIAQCLNCSSDEIYFTSGSSEGNALVLNQSKFCLCSPFEHHNIIESSKSMIVNIHYLNTLVEYLRDEHQQLNDSGLSWMYVNNETGEIFDLEKIKNYKINLKLKYFHSDMTQAIGKVLIDFKKMNYIDMATFSGHKFHSPKGIGFVYFNKNSYPANNIVPLITGGGQEKNVRNGTENIPYIHGMALALEITLSNMKKEQEHCSKLKKLFINELKSEGFYDFILVSPKNSISSIINVCFKNIEGEILVACLSDEEIYVSSGSACNTGSLEPSTVLTALGINEQFIRGEIRLSTSLNTTEEDIIKTAKALKKYYKQLV